MTHHLDSKESGLPPEIKSVLRTWTVYSEQTETLVHLTHEGLAHIQRLPKVNEILVSHTGDSSKNEVQNQLQWKADRAKMEADAGFPILHAHSLLGLWGALECMIEDLFIASLETRPKLLANEAFAKVKMPVAMLTVADPHERLRAILAEAARSTNSDLGQGASKFERLLKMVSLDGPVPRVIADAVFSAQQIRNIWAHRGGIADAKFIERCPSMGAAAGSRVDMGQEDFGRYMHGLHMYGVVVLNRILRSWDLAEVTTECVGFKGSLTQDA